LCFDDLASGYRTRGWATRAAGYRAAISCFGTKPTSPWPQSTSGAEGQADIEPSTLEVSFSVPQLRETRRRAQDLGWIEMIVAPAKGRNAVYRWGPTVKNRQS